jgi:glycosyltransferase involved in cell wall biosynthesis
MLSIIIPAHNEETVIARGLRAILTGAEPGELEVIVACNGCTDRTAQIARGFGEPVRVLEIDQASKTAALNAADAVATAFPRVYLDADVRLDIESIRRLAAALDADPAVPLVAPRLRMDLEQTTWAVRAFYRVWMSLPYNQVMVGTGAYALSRAGRNRFGAFPHVISDDGFARFQFRPEERRTVDDAEVCVTPPRSLAGLIRIKTRSRAGCRQLRELLSDLRTADPKPPMAALAVLLRRPQLWSGVPVYLYVNLRTRYEAVHRLGARASRWERDDSRAAP